MKLFLFDFDGVLVESLDLYYKTIGFCLQKINKPLTYGREELLELFEDNLYESLARRGVNLQEFMEVSGSVHTQINYKEIHPINAMIPVVEELQKNNVLLVITSNYTSTIQEAMEQYKLDVYFREVLGCDFLLSKKEKIIYASDKYQVRLEDIYYIGDTTGDVKEARAAGVKTVGVTWGWHSKEKMVAVNPDYLFQKPEELLQLKN